MSGLWRVFEKESVRWSTYTAYHWASFRRKMPFQYFVLFKFILNIIWISEGKILWIILSIKDYNRQFMLKKQRDLEDWLFIFSDKLDKYTSVPSSIRLYLPVIPNIPVLKRSGSHNMGYERSLKRENFTHTLIHFSIDEYLMSWTLTLLNTIVGTYMLDFKLNWLHGKYS